MPDHEKALQILGLAQDIAQYASDLAHCGSEQRDIREINGCDPQSNADGNISREILLIKCEKIYKLRRERERLFGKSGMFCDPSWDLLLDLFMGHLRGDQISVTSAGVAACAPVTTALRWLSILEKDGFVRREHDPADGRRMFVSLTDVAIDNMTKLLESH